MHRYYLILLLLSSGPLHLSAQAIMDEYARLALRQNQTITERKALERKQAFALAHAGKLAGPEVDFVAGYTLAGGGRSIELPVGFLLNDVYSTLNNLTGTQNFQQIRNEEVTFLPNNFYDVRFRLRQPILQPDIKYNKLIKEEELTLASQQTGQASRDLIHEVKSVYLQWMQAAEVVSILHEGLLLLQENKRITDALIQNGQGLPSARMRIHAELEQVQAQIQKAQADLTNAATYFNFLLHEPADAPILKDNLDAIPDIPVTIADIQKREELQQLETGKRIQSLALKLEEKQHAPTLGLQIEAGSQAFAPAWGGYYLGGIQLEIPIWDNRKSKLRQQEWQAHIDATEARYNWTRKAFEVQYQNEVQRMIADVALYESYSSLHEANQRYYQEMLRRYKEGLAGYIELLDARTQVTHARLQQNIARYQAWLRHVTIERLTAVEPIEK